MARKERLLTGENSRELYPNHLVKKEMKRSDSMSEAEILLMNILKGRYGKNLEDCIEWIIVKYFDGKQKGEPK